MKSTLVAAAFSGMVVGATALAQAETKQPGDEVSRANSAQQQGAQQLDDKGDSDKHACKSKSGCKGKNSCKGKGGCKTDKHACKGQNACKGQGGCKG